jgi:menaquinone-dependent protoporphyrinogen oxidase
VRVLVTAASRHGATFEIARRIGETLATAGVEADVRRPDEVASVAPYDGVVIGSAVYAGRWLDPARDLVQREAVALATRPVWLFSSGPLGDPPKPAEDPGEVAGHLDATRAIEHRVFAGKSDPKDLGLAEKVIFRVVHAPSGDYRRWDEVVAWATEIARALRADARVERPATIA